MLEASRSVRRRFPVSMLMRIFRGVHQLHLLPPLQLL